MFYFKSFNFTAWVVNFFLNNVIVFLFAHFFIGFPEFSSSVYRYVCARSVSRVWLWPHRLYSTRLICPWNFPGKNTGVSCHFLFQGIFLAQGSNPHSKCLLRRQEDSSPLRHLGSPTLTLFKGKISKNWKSCI